MKQLFGKPVWRALRMAVIAVLACLFAFQNVSGRADFAAGGAAGAEMARADCTSTPGGHPVDRDAHANHCCLACNHRSADKLLLGLAAFTILVAELRRSDERALVPLEFEGGRLPDSGWATSWSSRAPPSFS